MNQDWHTELRTKREKDAIKLLAKHALSLDELAEELGVFTEEADSILKALKTRGLNVIQAIDQRYMINQLLEHGGHVVLSPKPDAKGWIKFGFVTDNHLGNKHSRLDVLQAAYDAFEEDGITHVLQAGNFVDGEFRLNRNELIVFGIDAQLRYWANEWPVKKDITTYFITGDDHEGWWNQREMINVGEHAEDVACREGRLDLKYIGHVEADVELKTGNGSAALRLMHPGGGSAYAISYAPQKIVESLQGGEKPPILLIGHYHKFDYCQPREVHCISGGCTCDQTMFMRKNKIAAHVGYSIIRIKQNSEDGHIERVGIDWVPFYDRKFYERRFG